jgi:hypothetical protein
MKAPTIALAGVIGTPETRAEVERRRRRLLEVVGVARPSTLARIEELLWFDLEVGEAEAWEAFLAQPDTRSAYLTPEEWPEFVGAVAVAVHQVQADRRARRR